MSEADDRDPITNKENGNADVFLGKTASPKGGKTDL